MIKKILTIMLSLSLCVALSACTLAQKRQKETAAIFEVYQQYGLIYDMESDRLYYNSELVRYFEDIVDEEHYTEWPSRDGDIDVYAVRDELGVLSGVEKVDAQSFASRTAALKNTTIFELQIVKGITADGYTSNVEELIKDRLDRTYSVYQQYGLVYDKQTDRLYYNDELVGYFEDEANGISFGPYDDSELTIYAIRDQHGNLTGLDVTHKAN